MTLSCFFFFFFLRLITFCYFSQLNILPSPGNLLTYLLALDYLKVCVITLLFSDGGKWGISAQYIGVQPTSRNVYLNGMYNVAFKLWKVTSKWNMSSEKCVTSVILKVKA